MTLQASSEAVFATSRIVAFAPGQVFQAFADPQQLAAWWGPAGFRNTFEVFEFKHQGQWRFVMHGPDGKDYLNESTFLEVEPRRIVVRHDSAPQFTLTITLNDMAGQTRVDWRQAFDDAQVAQSLAHIVVPANEQNLDRLAAVLMART